MFDIEKELKQLNIEKIRPDDALRSKTRALVLAESRRIHAVPVCAEAVSRPRPVRRFAWVSAAAALALAFMLVLSPIQTAQAAGYYTIDINPSISLGVDADDTVLSVTAADSDAAALMEGLKLEGLAFGDALNVVVQAAAQAGYLKADGHVLVAHFGDSDGISEQQVQHIANSVSGDTVRVVLLKGTKDDYVRAREMHQDAGIALLKNNARDLGLDEDAGTDAIISAICEKKAGKDTEDNENSADETDPQESTKPSASAVPGNSGQSNGKPPAGSNENGNSAPSASSLPSAPAAPAESPGNPDNSGKEDEHDSPSAGQEDADDDQNGGDAGDGYEGGGNNGGEKPENSARPAETKKPQQSSDTDD